MNTEVVQTLIHAFGTRAVAYVLAVSSEAVGTRDIAPDPSRDRVARELLAMLDEARRNAGTHSSSGQQLTMALTATGPGAGRSRANEMRALAGGAIAEVGSHANDVDQLFAELAVDSYAALLVAEATTLVGGGAFPLMVHSNARVAELENAALADDDFARFFASGTPDLLGPVGYSRRSTWEGTPLQLALFAPALLSAGFRRAQDAVGDPTPEQFVDALLEVLATLRSGIRGERATIPVRVGLAGVRLPDGVSELELGWARLRRADARDVQYRWHASLASAIALTQPSVDCTVPFVGDIVLEVDTPYRVLLGEADATDWIELFGMPHGVIEEMVESVRLGLLLAAPEGHFTLIPIWRAYLDPLSFLSASGWRDVTHASLYPRQLSSAEAEQWREWAGRVHAGRVPSIAIGIRRMLLAASDRLDTIDKVVDAVIVWENLFGGRTDTTRRVTRSLALLLGRSPAEVDARQRQYKEIYNARSRLVHGSPEFEMRHVDRYSHEATTIAIAALRALFTDRSALLDHASSEARSDAILAPSKVVSVDEG